MELARTCSKIEPPDSFSTRVHEYSRLGTVNMTAKHELQNHLVHWVAQLAATSINDPLYHIAPPWHKEISTWKQTGEFMSRFYHHRKRRSQPETTPHDE